MVKSGVRHDYDLRSNLCVDGEAICLVCNEQLKGNTRMRKIWNTAESSAAGARKGDTDD